MAMGAANSLLRQDFIAVNYVVNYYDTFFTNNVTININVTTVIFYILTPTRIQRCSSGDLGANYQNNETSANYLQEQNVLLGVNAPGAHTLPVQSPPGSKAVLYGLGRSEGFGVPWQ